MPFFVYLIVTCKIHYIHIEIFLIDDGTLQAYLYILNAKKIYYDIYIKRVILKSRECCVCIYHKIIYHNHFIHLSLYSIHIIIIPLSLPQQHIIIILLSLYSNTKQQHTIFQLKTTCSIVYLIKLSSFST